MSNELVEKKQEMKYDTNDVQIAEMSARLMILKVRGPEDKEGLKKMTQYRIEAKGVRVTIEHNRKANNEKANKYIKDNNAEAKRLAALALPAETHCIEQENIVKNETARIKAEEQAKIKEAHRQRILLVIDSGALFDGSHYVYGEASLSDEEIWNLSDEDFALKINSIKIWKENEDLKKANQKKLDDEEAERQAEIAKEQEAEKVRLDKIAADQAKEKADLEAEKAELAEERNNSRIDKLNAIGLVYNHVENSFLFEDVNVSMVELKTMNKTEWAELIEKIVPAIKDRKEEAEKFAKAKAEQKIKEATEKAEKEAEKKAEEKEANRLKEESEAKAKADKEKKAADRKARLAPDKDKLYNFAVILSELEFPKLKEDESRLFFEPLKNQIQNIVSEINDKTR